MAEQGKTIDITRLEKTKKGGRIPTIQKIDLDKVTDLASVPGTITQIAEGLDIPRTTFYELLKTEPEFKEAYEKGVSNRKYMLEQALFKRAEGFQAEETQTVVTDDPEKGRIVKNTVTRKNYVPDAVSLIFALKNMYPEKYKDKIETTTNINVNIKHIEALSNEELMKIAGNNEIAIGTEDYKIE
jgi:hypothetical protein